MILIADSGSTKTDWALLDDNAKLLKRVKTQGLNPFHLSDDNIAEILEFELVDSLEGASVDRINFNGTGCTSDKIEGMRAVLSAALHCNDVFVGSDLLGAAHALCCHSEGIACILGTGANSCLFDGKKIVANTPPLGYILGDEGSGAVLGRNFLNGIFKGRLSAELRDKFLKQTNQTYEGIINKVYKEQLANRYLARIAMFVGQNKEEFPELKQLVKDNFSAFLHYNIDAYGRTDLPLGFVGSIAWYFQSELKEAVEAAGYTLGKVIKSPLDGMVDYVRGENG